MNRLSVPSVVARFGAIKFEDTRVTEHNKIQGVLESSVVARLQTSKF